MGYYAASGEPPEDEDGRGLPPSAGQDHELLPYRVEVWDPTGAFVEQVVALTGNRSVGWAAFFATKEQFPSRLVTFRDQFGELSRWNANKH